MVRGSGSKLVLRGLKHRKSWTRATPATESVWVRFMGYRSCRVRYSVRRQILTENSVVVNRTRFRKKLIIYSISSKGCPEYG